MPVPLIKRSPHPQSEAVAAVVGPELAEPLVRLEAAIEEAKAAVAELETCRPGAAGTRDGARWADAVATDAEAAEGGERPRRWRCEELLEREPHRWAQASALARAVPLLLRRTSTALDRRRISAAAATVEAAKATAFAEVARVGWEGRADKAAAWQRVRAGEMRSRTT